MKKLMTLCFGLLLVVVAVLSIINYSFDGIDKIEMDKQLMTITKPEKMSNESFLGVLEQASEKVKSDIMYRYIDVTADKPHYLYFKTNYSNHFISIMDKATNLLPVTSDLGISTKKTAGKDGDYSLQVSSVFQDISFFDLASASPYNLNSGSYYVKKNASDELAEALIDTGIEPEFSTTALISGKLPIGLFIIIPIFLFLMSMVFYVLSNGKKNVLKKMDGYTTTDILKDELKASYKGFLVSLVIVLLVTYSTGAYIFKSALFKYILFSLNYFAIVLGIVLIGILLSSLVIIFQNKAEYIKGKIPKNGMYYIAMGGKCLFMLFSLIFMSMAVRNVVIYYNTYQASEFVAKKIDGYVTIPIYNNNQSTDGQAENYLEFYKETVDQYDGILISAANYEVDVQSGMSSSEEFNQDFIEVNTNYLAFNPIYQEEGTQINRENLSTEKINVLMPDTKLSETKRYQEFIRTGYGQEANFITYQTSESDIYSYNATTGTGSYGQLDDPIVIVVTEEILSQAEEFVFSYCSKGEYFIKPKTAKPYEELSPMLVALGIDNTTPELPYVSSTFSDTMSQMFDMFMLYGTQTVLLTMGLLCLVIFSSRLYCENFRKKIAFSMIEGDTLFNGIKKHMLITMVTYGLSMIILPLAYVVITIRPNYYLLVGCFMVEVIAIYLTCQKYTRISLYDVAKGAE